MTAPRTPRVGNVAEAAIVAEKRLKAEGPTVRLRAIERGQYGRPLAVLREPGDEFHYYVRDLVERNTLPKNEKDFMGRPIRSIRIPIDGKMIEYALPHWCEDGRQPKAPEPDAADLELAAATDGDDVL